MAGQTDQHEPPRRRIRTRYLSDRELDVVRLAADGLSNDEIAGRLRVSPRTVQTYVANALKKTNSRNRADLSVLAVREGIVPLNPR